MDKEFDDALDLDLDEELKNLTPYPNPTAPAQEVIRLLETCPICGSGLHSTHFADFSLLTSHEVVRCDDCGYKAQRDMSRLQ